MRKYTLYNNIVGWIVFSIAAVSYLMTMESSTSLWDVSEFTATAYKLQVGHPPGAPLYMMLARIATMFAPSTQAVPIAVNAFNSIISAFTILFLFWTITHIARRLYAAVNREIDIARGWSVIAAGAVGALAYTFTDTFWFSAIEGEVYALSSMFTALVVWLMLKWEDEADEPHSMRWILLIVYLMGLSIGVHILNLLTIPALVFIYYFRKCEKVDFKGILAAMVVSGAMLLFINGFVISRAIWIGAMIDLFFVNTLGLPINSGMALYSLALIIGLGAAAYWAHRKGRKILNMIFLCMTLVFIGYSSYASITIRAVANPPMNSNNPNNPHALLSFLNRDQYGARPLIYGASYAAPVEDFTSRDIYFVNDDGKYEKCTILSGYKYSDDFMMLFPRIWDSAKGESAYKPWAAYRTQESIIRDNNGEIIRSSDGSAVVENELLFGEPVEYGSHTIIEPTRGEHLYYFFTYQLNYMFWRYFLWNFVGRQSNNQAQGATIAEGNWMSGIKSIDQAYIGPQSELPREIETNEGRNKYYFLPFILGLIGLIYQLNRDPKNFSIVMWLFVMMGIALVVYFNTSPGEPRERDYVYAGAFYAFTIWIGLGVIALFNLLLWFTKGQSQKVALATAVIISMSVPVILATENWDDHDRSGRTMARDIGWNYLQSTLPNSIIMNYGDNDTFPLWYNQEVDGVRTDVRIMNTSYLGGEWYIDQMKNRSYDAQGVPFSLHRSKYTYVNDYVPIIDRVERAITVKEAINFIANDSDQSKVSLADGSKSDFLPSRKMILPVNKENAIAAGIVKEEDAHLMVDSIRFDLKGSSINKSQMMILDLLSSFDWKRPIYFTQAHMLQDIGLLDYAQFDGYGFRLVPIRTLVTSYSEIGRIDTDYTAPLLLETFRYGNLNREDVYIDNFFQYNLNAARTRQAFALTAKEAARGGDEALALKLLDRGLEVLPTNKLRFNEDNTLPFIEGYYMIKQMQKGDELLQEYADNIIEYIEYYLLFQGYQASQIDSLLDDRLGELATVYKLAAAAKRVDIVNWLNDYYRTLGAEDEDLIILE
ncbi:MAG: DUF2723 domain-containing protein [Rikenellaceae bacterium]